MSTNRIDGSEIFSLTEPYSQQTPLELPRDEGGSRFAPLEWTKNGSRILGRLWGGTWAMYHLDSQEYEILEGTAPLSDLTPSEESLFLGSLDKDLVLYDRASGEISALLSTAPDSLQGVRLAPDGRTIYFLRASVTSDIHLLEVAD
jgi:WD40 repeat protein